MSAEEHLLLRSQRLEQLQLEDGAIERFPSAVAVLEVLTKGRELLVEPCDELAVQPEQPRRLLRAGQRGDRGPSDAWTPRMHPAEAAEVAGPEFIDQHRTMTRRDVRLRSPLDHDPQEVALLSLGGEHRRSIDLHELRVAEEPVELLTSIRVAAQFPEGSELGEDFDGQGHGLT
ncbi:MAG: hypothetical protein KDC38_01310 [Planctomycetes bacterium]|nr:hypothetical protein [Planctomycetota bacterium]